MMKPILRLMLLVSAAGVCLSCDDASTAGKYTNFAAFEPTDAIGVRLSVNALSLSIFSGVCSPGTRLTTGVDLVVTASRGPFSLDTVTLHMIDGSNLGGPGITFPSSQLVQMFGTTSVADTRVFTLRPEFTCHGSIPRSVEANVIVVDGSGNAKALKASVAFP
jgi:hypothetical protein